MINETKKKKINRQIKWKKNSKQTKIKTKNGDKIRQINE